MSSLPEGIVTFAFTDVEGSTSLWEDSGDVMMEALEIHDSILDRAVETHDGVSVKPRGEGDSRFLVFGSAPDAVAAMAEIQRGLAEALWPTTRPLKVRAALHTGTADLRAGDYYGSAVNRTARLRAIAHGGQTVMSRVTWDLTADSLPDDVTVEDMGAHKLKDLTRSEHVFQLHIDGLQSDFPPLASLHTIPNNLPEQVTDFVGREKELADTKRLLGEARLLTLLAPGGAGKTRLAIQAAADVAGDYPDGVFFVPLADIARSDDIVQAVAEALKLGLSAGQDIEAQLLTYLATRHQLLIFDNFEHIVGGSTLISSILEAAPNVRVLATSRSKLGLSGETVLALQGLDIEWSNPEDAYSTGGVELFDDAARRANPAFVLDDDALDPLGRILDLTGGMPLAIVLAASWADMLSIDEIAKEISKSLDFLESEHGDIPDRHRSVRAVFEYSWALLDDKEQKTFANLAVFRGGFTRGAAEAVAGASLRNLASLSHKSLVVANPETGRYVIHELLRQYAQDELETDQERCDRILREHAGFYASVAETAFELMFTSDQPRMAAIIETDLDNIRASWRYYLSTGNMEGARRLILSLFQLYEWRGWYQSAVALFGEPLDADIDDSVEAVRLRLMAQTIQSWFLALLGQAETAAPVVVEAKAGLRDIANSVENWVARQCVAIAVAYRGDVETMVAVTDEGIEITTNRDDPFFAASMKNWRSFAALLAQDFEKADEILPEAMVVFEQRNDHYFATWNLWLQALISTFRGKPLDAIDLFTRQVHRADELGYLRGKVVALEGLGDANLSAELHHDAEVAYVESLTTAEKMGMVVDMLGLMTKIARVWAASGKESEAAELLSTITSEPLSQQQHFNTTVPIRELAEESLSRLRKQMDPAGYEHSTARGSDRRWDEAAKRLIDRKQSNAGSG